MILKLRHIGFVLLFAATAAANPADMGALHPVTVSRSISDAWNYNRLQATVLEAERGKIEAELARLAAQRAAVEKRLRDDFGVDVAGGDVWDETTLVITRRAK